MARRSTITLEGPTLRVCRKTAAEKLGASEDQLSYEIQQYGRKGWFSSTPFRVRFTRKDAAKERKGKGGLSERVDQYMDLVKRDLDRVEALDQSGLNLSFDELLESYEDLDEGSKKELVELAGLMSGTKSEDARRVVEAVSRSGEFTVTVSEDKQKAVLAITPPKASGKPVALKDVMSYLGQQNIVQGVDHVKIGRVLEECQKLGEPIRDVLIAEGTLPTRGRDGAAQVLFTPGAKEVLIDEAGRADYRGKAQIAQVEKDQPLVKILKATEGRAGTNVYGEPIPAPSGKSVQVKAGEGTYYDEEASEIRAAMDGVAEFDGTEVLVRPRVLVEDDVGMKTGNVEFDGEVEVRGSVLDNFAVRATGDVLIHGQVEGAEVVSTEGSVTVKKGVAGRGRCFISAAHTVTVRYVENATIYAGEEVVADRAILNSKVVAGKTVRVQVGKGMIAGGEVHAGELVDARRGQCQRAAHPDRPGHEPGGLPTHRGHRAPDRAPGAGRGQDRGPAQGDRGRGPRPGVVAACQARGVHPAQEADRGHAGQAQSARRDTAVHGRERGAHGVRDARGAADPVRARGRGDGRTHVPQRARAERGTRPVGYRERGDHCPRHRLNRRSRAWPSWPTTRTPSGRSCSASWSRRATGSSPRRTGRPAWTCGTRSARPW